MSKSVNPNDPKKFLVFKATAVMNAKKEYELRDVRPQMILKDGKEVQHHVMIAPHEADIMNDGISADKYSQVAKTGLVYLPEDYAKKSKSASEKADESGEGKVEQTL